MNPQLSPYKNNLIKGILILSLLFLIAIIPIKSIAVTSYLSFPTKIDTKQERMNVQTVLNNVMTPSPNLMVDGVLGRKSIQTVQAFQEINGLVADGKIGPVTRSVLEKAQISDNTQPTITQTNIINTSSLECPPGASFSIKTGKPCTSIVSTLSEGCTSTTLFNTLTGLSCGSKVSTISSSNIPTTVAPTITSVIRSGGGGSSRASSSSSVSSGASTTVSSAASSAPTPTCSGSTTSSCTITNGTGTQSRTCNSGTWSNYGTCGLTSCNSGYTQSGNTCVVQTYTCSGSNTRSCSITNGQGNQSATCNTSTGQWIWGTTCSLSSCTSGYQISGNSCIATTCTGLSTSSCTITNGTGTQSRTCNLGTWSSYGSCNVSSCNTGYTQSGNGCTALTCSGSTSQSCTIINGTGTQSRTCNLGTWSNYGTCGLTSCNSGYQISGNSCVTIPDTTKPTITAFTIPTTSSSLTVSISSLIASDAVGVTGYLLTESSTTPSSGSGSWTSSPPTTYTFSTSGTKTLYSWAKDGAGNVSTGTSSTVTLSVPSGLINLVQNPGFENGLNSWSPFTQAGGAGTKEIVSIDGKNALYVNNTDGGQIGVSQNINLPNPSNNPFLVSYKFKVASMYAGALAGLDLYPTSSAGGTEWIVDPFKAREWDVGKWVDREFIIYEKNPISSFSLLLLNYYEKSVVYYDDVVLSEITNTEDFVINNNYVNLTLTSFGYVKSLKYNNQELLIKSAPLSVIYFDYGIEKSQNKYASSKSITSLGNNLYKVQYTNSNTETILRITPADEYFKFELVDLINPEDNINYIKLFEIASVNFAQTNKVWAESASNNEIFINSLSLNPNTNCNPEFSPVSRKNTYSCQSNRWMGLTNASGVLLTVPKRDYFDAMEKVVLDNNLPYLVLEDGKWFRKSSNLRDSYLFFTMTPSNHNQILQYAQLANFKQVLFIDPVYWGSYSKPDAFNSINEFYSASDGFSNAGIKIGIHTFVNQLFPGDYLLDYYNPAVPLKEVIYSIPLGRITQNLNQNNPIQIIVNKNLDSDENFKYFTTGLGINAVHSGVAWYFLIDNEIVTCSSYSSNTLSNCQRAAKGTQKTTHSANAEIRIVPSYQAPFIFPGTSYQTTSALSLANFFDRVDASFVYFDGTPFVGLPGMDQQTRREHKTNLGVIEYINKFIKLPILQFGEGSSSFVTWLFEARVASWDGPTYKAKAFTKNFKTKTILTNNPYENIKIEMGWWKFFGANIGSGNYDIEAITFDDIHYAMTKVLALDTSMGLQLGIFYEKHERLDDLFRLMGLYNKLADQDMKNNIIPKNIKDYLRQLNNEAELNNVSGWNFVEKKIDDHYANWNSTSNYSYTINNPFGNQKIKVDIRPRVDFYGFGDPRNTLIVNYSDPNSNSKLILDSDSGINCTINSSGIISINNTGNINGSCSIKIDLLSLAGGNLNLTGKRGIGLSITGDNKNELIKVRLSDSGQYGYREFKFLANFSGKKEIILGEATGDVDDTVNGEVLPNTPASEMNNPMSRNWDYEYQNNRYATIIIRNIKPGQNYSLQLHELKALKEKTNNKLVNPTININGNPITFNVNLSVDDISPNILEYDGYKNEYNIYNSNYKLLSTGNVVGPDILKGNNTIQISSDTSNPDFSTRADIRISVYDDEDGDLIPTNGNYGGNYYPCTGQNNFCDDNCPTVYNPDQTDSDNDAVGEVCDIDTPKPENVLGISTYNLTLNLKYGSSGNEVRELQKILISNGYLSDTPDGIYGSLTLNAVKEYQKANGLTPDGIIGLLTRKILNK